MTHNHNNHNNEKKRQTMSNKTIIRNEFTGYRATITHKGKKPAVSTVKKHLRAAKARDCQSITRVEQTFDAIEEGQMPRTVILEIIDTGNGERLEYVG